jgi:hypothetical protein
MFDRIEVARRDGRVRTADLVVGSVRSSVTTMGDSVVIRVTLENVSAGDQLVGVNLSTSCGFTARFTQIGSGCVPAWDYRTLAHVPGLTSYHCPRLFTS